jgi:hypothetical protein
MGITKKFIDASKATYDSIEDHLEGAFRSVPPRKEFVRELGHRIRVQSQAVTTRLTDFHFLIIVFAGIFSIVALIWVGVRAIIDLGNVRRRIPRQT